MDGVGGTVAGGAASQAMGRMGALAYGVAWRDGVGSQGGHSVVGRDPEPAGRAVQGS